MCRLSKVVLLLTLLLGVVTLSRPAHADEAGDRAAAEALYQLAQRLMSEGNYADACPKLEASQKLDPGVGTLLFLGECQEKLGKLASAWATFQQAGELARARNEPDRVSVAEVRATALKPRLAYVVFKVDGHNRMPDFELRRGGVVIASGSWGVPLPTDAGRYELTATADGYETWSSTFEVPADFSGALNVKVPPLHAETQADVAPPSSTSQKSAPAPDRAPSSSAQKTWGIITFGAGTAAAIASGVLSYLAASRNSESKSSCRRQDPNLCWPEGVKLRNDAKNLANLATGFGIGGGVAMAAGAVLFLTAPASSERVADGLELDFRAQF